MAFIEINIDSARNERNIISAKIDFNVIDCELCNTEEIIFKIFSEGKIVYAKSINNASYIPYSDLEKPDGYQLTVAYYIPSRNEWVGFHKIIKEENSAIITTFEGPFLLEYNEPVSCPDEMTVKEINYYENLNSGRFTVKVYAIIYNEKSDILLIEKKETETQKRKYCLPGGKVEKGEPPLKALEREIKEEIGLNIEIKGYNFVHQMARKRKNGDKLIYIFFKKYISYSDFQKINAKEPNSNIIWANFNDLPKNSVSYLKHVLYCAAVDQHYSEYGY